MLQIKILAHFPTRKQTIRKDRKKVGSRTDFFRNSDFSNFFRRGKLLDSHYVTLVEGLEGKRD